MSQRDMEWKHCSESAQFFEHAAQHGLKIRIVKVAFQQRQLPGLHLSSCLQRTWAGTLLCPALLRVDISVKVGEFAWKLDVNLVVTFALHVLIVDYDRSFSPSFSPSFFPSSRQHPPEHSWENQVFWLLGLGLEHSFSCWASYFMSCSKQKENKS